jgi:hypothetical protein
MPIHERAESHPTDIDRETILHDGVRTWLKNPALTDAQRKEIEALLPEEDERDKEAATILANQAIKRRRKELNAMDYTPSDEFGKTIQQLEELHNGPARLRKSIEDLEDQVDALRDQVRGNGATHSDSMDYIRQELDDVKRALREMRSAGVTKDHLHRVMSDVWDRMDDDAEERRPPDPIADANKSLTESVASFLPDNATWDDSKQTMVLVLKSFGRRGGQQIRYDKELAGRLLLSRSISPQEHDNWKKYNRLPDDVTLQSHGRAQAEADRAMMNAYAVASMNLSPLAVQHWLMHRR